MMDDDQGEGSGSAYVYVRSGTTWTSEAKLLAQLPDGTKCGQPDDEFGQSVAIAGDTIVVGSPRDDAFGDNAGAAYVYTRSGSSWSVQAKLQAQLPGGVSDAASVNDFGYSVALSADRALIGSQGPGAYLFTRSNSVWSSHLKLTPKTPN